MSDAEQKVEEPANARRPLDDTRLAQLAVARELAVKARKEKAILKQKEKMLEQAEAEAKARQVDEKLKKLKKTKVESSSESEEERPRRPVKREPVSASRTQIQHELQMLRRQMAMRAMFQAPAF